MRTSTTSNHTALAVQGCATLAGKLRVNLTTPEDVDRSHTYSIPIAFIGGSCAAGSFSEVQVSVDSACYSVMDATTAITDAGVITALFSLKAEACEVSGATTRKLASFACVLAAGFFGYFWNVLRIL